MGAIWAMSRTTSPGMCPVHLESASRFTGLMTWSVDRSILRREGRLQGAGRPGRPGGSLLSHSGAVGRPEGPGPINCETADRSRAWSRPLCRGAWGGYSTRGEGARPRQRALLGLTSASLMPLTFYQDLLFMRLRRTVCSWERIAQRSRGGRVPVAATPSPPSAPSWLFRAHPPDPFSEP